jgi:hypothetical protein
LNYFLQLQPFVTLPQKSHSHSAREDNAASVPGAANRLLHASAGDPLARSAFMRRPSATDSFAGAIYSSLILGANDQLLLEMSASLINTDLHGAGSKMA